MLLGEGSVDPITVWPTVRTGELYNRMGYTTCFEPAMLLSGARHTHLELADTPFLDAGAYVVVGNEDWLLQALAAGVEDAELQALVGWTVDASQAMAVKVVNAGGINAFKFNQRMLEVDEPHVRFGVTPRDVIRRLTACVEELDICHPLHVHASNLGVPGNVKSAIATLEAAEGRRIHLTHAQFNCYSNRGPFGMGSGAIALAEYVNQHSNVSLDIGQVVFGQTVTISADSMAQSRNRRHASPKWSLVGDIECQAGCGVVPMRYQDKQYVHSLQWTIGLELMLLVNDPWRIFLTTDHPNGGPFTCYPHLIRLLMDRSFRQSVLETLHPEVSQNATLRELTREYSLDEIAIVTRCAPARILGLPDRGTLTAGSMADAAVYRLADDWESTFSQAAVTMKAGHLISTASDQLNATWSRGETLIATPRYDGSLFARRFQSSIEQTLQMPLSSLAISQQEMSDLIRGPVSRSTGASLAPRAGAKHAH
jgi:formylmethanofuran dehydrogenase subunit A